MLIITDNAAEKLRPILAQHPGSVLRVALDGLGWGGPRLGLALDEPEVDDERAEVNGIAVAIRPDEANWVRGALVDYVQDGLREGFLVRRAGDECGEGCC